MSFDDVLQDLDPKYQGMSSGGFGNFLKEEELVAGFTGIYKGREKATGQFGPTMHWKFEVDGQEVVLNRPHMREVEDKETKAKMKKPTRFLVSFMNAKIEENDKVFIKQTGKGFNINYEIRKVD